MLKYLSISAAITTACGLGAFAHAAKPANPNVSISCFGESKACKKNEIGITNNSTTQEVSNLYVSCPDKDTSKNKKNVVKTYEFRTFDLDPKETKCYDTDDINDNCFKSAGIFVDYNVDIMVQSEDYPRWKTTDSCTWLK